MRVGSDPGAGAGHKIHFVVIKFAFYHFTFFCSACVCVCVWLFGARQLYCVKLMMRRFSSAFCLLLLLRLLLLRLLLCFFFLFFCFLFWLLSSCNRNAQTELSTKCRAKDVFINSPATWPRLNAILRTRTACPMPNCLSDPFWLDGLSLFESFLLLRKSKSPFHVYLLLSVAPAPSSVCAGLCACVCL